MHLVIQRLQNVHLGLNLRFFSLSHTVHVDLTPRNFDALLLIVALVHRLERAVT